MTRAAIWTDSAAWDAYVATRPDAYNYHRWLWAGVIKETFGHEPRYIAATREGRIQGILPLVEVRSRLFGSSLVSVPFFSYGGLLAETADAREALLKQAWEIARRLKVPHVELRQGRALECPWQETALKITMKVLLPNKPDVLWNRISTGLRNKLRKAQNSQLRMESAGASAIDSFYPVFAANMRNLGTPVYPRRWFEAIARAAGDQLRIFTLFDGATPVASAFLLAHRDELELPWSASVPESRKKYSHLLLYWIFLEWAIQNGFRYVDLGRCTPGSGTYEFKRHWGCEEQVLHWYHWVSPGKSVPQLRPDNAKFQLATRVWQHLPLAIANGLGPRIVRGLP